MAWWLTHTIYDTHMYKHAYTGKKKKNICKIVTTASATRNLLLFLWLSACDDDLIKGEHR